MKDNVIYLLVLELKIFIVMCLFLNFGVFLVIIILWLLFVFLVLRVIFIIGEFFGNFICGVLYYLFMKVEGDDVEIVSLYFNLFLLRLVMVYINLFVFVKELWLWEGICNSGSVIYVFNFLLYVMVCDLLLIKLLII